MGIKPWATTNSTVWTAPSGAVVTGLVDADNPLAIRPYTMRLQFSDSSYDPTSESWLSGSFWTQVSSSPNVWDFTYARSNWFPSNTGPFYRRFHDRNNLVSVLGGNLLGVVDISRLFFGCTALQFVAVFDTSTVINMYNTFSGCTILQAIPALNTSNVTDMKGAFSYCSRLTTIPLLDTSKVTDMSNLFTGCDTLTSVPLLDTSSATTMSEMFLSCSALTTIPQFNTSSVVTMSSMFRECYSLTSLPLLDTSSVTDMSRTFTSCSSLTALPLFDTRHVVDMRYMCASCSSLTSLPLLNTTNADNVESMFQDCLNVEQGALALYQQMTTQLVEPMKHSSCFYQCGINTSSGSAELAQIPRSWGGTAT